MLVLSFDIGPDCYALDAARIVEVLPLSPIRQTPGTPDYVAGMILYRGRAVPVIDISQMALNRPSRRFMSTRILITSYCPGPGRPDEMLGLIAERATDTRRVDEAELEPPVVEADQAPYLGRLSLEGGQVIQLVEIDHLLTIEAKELLFPDD